MASTQMRFAGCASPVVNVIETEKRTDVVVEVKVTVDSVVVNSVAMEKTVDVPDIVRSQQHAP